MIKRALDRFTISGRLWMVIVVTGACIAALSAYSFQILKQRGVQARASAHMQALRSGIEEGME